MQSDGRTFMVFDLWRLAKRYFDVGKDKFPTDSATR